MSGSMAPSELLSGSSSSMRATKVRNVGFYSFCISDCRPLVEETRRCNPIFGCRCLIHAFTTQFNRVAAPFQAPPSFPLVLFDTCKIRRQVSSRSKDFRVSRIQSFRRLHRPVLNVITCFYLDSYVCSTTNIIDISTRAPHLAAILARRSSQNKQRVLFKQPSLPPAHSSSEYRPSSTQSFLSRLATYKLSTYANKPPQIDAVAAAKCGWINDGKDRLVCGICSVSWVLAAREGMTREAGKKVSFDVYNGG